MNIEQIVTYKSYCGCIHTKEEMSLCRVTETGAGTQRLRCPDHPDTAKGNIDTRQTTCTICGKIIEFSGKGGTIPALCLDCKTPIRLAKMRAWAKAHPQKKNLDGSRKRLRNEHLADPDRGANCKFRMICLAKYDKFQCTPCKGCKLFVLKEFDIAEYLSSRDNQPNSFIYTHKEKVL